MFEVCQKLLLEFVSLLTGTYKHGAADTSHHMTASNVTGLFFLGGGVKKFSVTQV